MREPANQNRINYSVLSAMTDMKTVQLTQNVEKKVSGKNSRLNKILKYGKNSVKEEGDMDRKTCKGKQIRKYEVLSAKCEEKEGYQAVSCVPC